jgi:hypothetical protein
MTCAEAPSFPARLSKGHGPVVSFPGGAVLFPLVRLFLYGSSFAFGRSEATSTMTTKTAAINATASVAIKLTVNMARNVPRHSETAVNFT